MHPREQLAADPLPHFLFATTVFGEAGKLFLVAAAVTATCSTVNSSWPRCRMLYGMAQNGQAFPQFKRLSRRARTPWVAVLFIAAITGLPILLLGQDPDAISLLLLAAALAWLLAYIIVHIDVIALRRRYPHIARPFRSPFYPWPQVLGIAGMLFAIYHVSPTPEMTAKIFGTAGVVLGLISVIAVAWIRLVMGKPLFVPEPLTPSEPAPLTRAALSPNRFDEQEKTMNAPITPQRSTEDYQAADAAHHIHAFLDQKALNAEGPRVITRGEGLYLWDNDGKRYLDGMSGLWCTNLGYGRGPGRRRRPPAGAAAVLQHVLPHHPPGGGGTLRTALQPAARPLQPRDLHQLRFRGERVLIRTVRRYWQILGQPQKKVMIGRWNGYHGSTLAATALGGMKFMHEMGGLIPDVAHIDEPYWFAQGGDLTPAEFGLRCARQLEEKILELGAENVAGFIAEPFQGAGGMIFRRSPTGRRSSASAASTTCCCARTR